MPFDLYVWQSPRDVDDARAAELVREWEEQSQEADRNNVAGWAPQSYPATFHVFEVARGSHPAASTLDRRTSCSSMDE